MPEKTAIVTQDQKSLIKQTKRDSAMTKIENLQSRHRSARFCTKSELLASYERELAWLFMKLLTRAYSVEPGELSQFDDEEIAEIAGVLVERTKLWRRLNKSFWLLVPVIGWVRWREIIRDPTLFNGSRSWRYARLLSIVRKERGQNYFMPRDRLIELYDKREQESGESGSGWEGF